MDVAFRGGGGAGGVGSAFLAGYHAALRALFPGLDRPATMCATEAEGAHPRSIQTRLSAGDRGFRLNGQKRWATGATRAEALFVFASEGTDDAGRNRLRCVRVDPRAPGVRIEAMPAPSFTPEIVHAVVTLDDVAVSAEMILPGDGYTRYLKPFRTVEDIHVMTALLGYLTGVACRCRWPASALEDLLALASAMRGLAAADPLSAHTHLALAGTLRWMAQQVDSFEPHWSLTDEATRAGWQRDRPLLQVAQRVRDQRLAAAWKALGGA
ncbi:MAG: acyl-CoA dehydrogenase family protein [Deltaproteobacteria bacterium]|nr:acyl-CoA dehydrogenase family protein [Deltaproteobacteria bacterium]